MKKRYALGARIAAVLVCLAFCVLVGALGEAAKAVGVSAAREKRPVYSVENGESEVSLGINCAWGNEDIPQLLDVLERYDVKVTFFIVGEWCDKFPESVRMIYDAGHEIGSHSDTHADMTKLDDAGILREIHDSAQKLEKITGAPVKLFRVPSGAYNSRVIELIEQEGMYPIQWDCEVMNMKTIKRIFKALQNVKGFFPCDNKAVVGNIYHFN